MYCVVFGFGSNYEDRLGVNENRVMKPVKLDHNGEVAFVNASGKKCTIDTAGQVSINGEKEPRIPTRAKFATSSSGSHFVIDSASYLWSWGRNGHGQLASGDTNDRQAPGLVEVLRDEMIKQMSVCDDCVGCTTVNYECFVWGDCRWLGLDSAVTMPTKLDDTHQIGIKSIEIGNGHAMMIDAADDVYVIGYNYWDALGTDDNADNGSSWTKVKNLTGEVIKVQCGQSRSAILTTTGVFVLGFGHGGSLPKQVALIAVADISLSCQHILALKKSGELFAWGWNRNGECGIDSNKSYIDKPTRVHGIENYQIRQISAGAGYSLICCAPK